MGDGAGNGPGLTIVAGANRSNLACTVSAVNDYSAAWVDDGGRFVIIGPGIGGGEDSTIQIAFFRGHATIRIIAVDGDAGAILHGGEHTNVAILIIRIQYILAGIRVMNGKQTPQGVVVIIGGDVVGTGRADQVIGHIVLVTGKA